MKIALGQFEAGSDKAGNLERIAELAREAKGAGSDLVVFPEAAMFHFAFDETLVAAAEELDGPFVSRLSELARINAIVVVAGIFEAIAGHDRVHNSVVVLDSDGSLSGVYRKIHLFDAFGYRESDWIEPGDGETLVVEIADVPVGVMTCYDVRFPELARHLADRGAQLIVLPAAWAQGPLKEEQWELLVRARAIENTVYVAAADQVGAGACGRSMVVDPMGIPVAAAGEVEGVVVGTVSAERVAEVRAKLPSLGHVRRDLYGQWLSERSARRSEPAVRLPR
jgi:predicted amidohydrolase